MTADRQEFTIRQLYDSEIEQVDASLAATWSFWTEIGEGEPLPIDFDRLLDKRLELMRRRDLTP